MKRGGIEGFIAFDYDGVIVDSLDANLAITNDVCVGLTGCRAVTPEDIEASDRMSFSAIADAVGVPDSARSECLDLINQRLAAAYVDLDFFPGMEDVLRRLRASGRKLYVVTHNTEVAVRGFLEMKGASDVFDGILGAEAKVEKEVKLSSLVASTGFPVSSCAMIGDSVGDLLSAKAAGVVSIGVSWGYQSRERLAATGADFILDSPEDILRLLGVD